MATSGFSSTLSLAMVSLPLCSSAISSSTGLIILHGPHHSAQKSTSTGVLDLSTSLSNVASVTAAALLIASGGAGTPAHLHLLERIFPPTRVQRSLAHTYSCPLRATGNRRPQSQFSVVAPASWPWASSQRSASMAAAHPVPAAVTACRYVWSTTSPAANTPSTLVAVDGGLGVTM